MANTIFNENRVVSTLVSEKDVHGYLRKIDRANDPFIFMTIHFFSDAEYNFVGVFKGTYVTSNQNVTYTFILSDEDPLPAIMSGENAPGKVLTTASGASCLATNLARNRCAMSASIAKSSLSENEVAQMNKIWNYPYSNISDVNLKIWLIVKTIDDRPARLRKDGPTMAYCEFLYTKDNVSSFAPLYRYEESAE